MFTTTFNEATNTIIVSSREEHEPWKLLASLNEHYPANVARKMFPSSYRMVMDEEKYGVFFSMGSPQMYEDCWIVTVTYTAGNTELIVTLPEQNY